MYVRTFDPFYREMVYANRTPAAATAAVLVSCPEQSSAHTDVLQEALQFPPRFQASVSLAAAGAAVGVGAVRTSLLAHHLQLAPPLTFLLLLATPPRFAHYDAMLLLLLQFCQKQNE